MSLNLEAVGSSFGPIERSWTSTDCLLYALGVGAGSLDPADSELAFTTENSTGVTQKVLPTFATVATSFTGGVLSLAGTEEHEGPLGSFDPAMLVHGEHAIELHGSLPTEATISTTGVIAGIYDKVTGALVVIDAESVDTATGKPIFSSTVGLFIRGEGGFGGDRGPSWTKDRSTSGPPDQVVRYPTRPDQALLFRLSGDRNPLHSDPVFAKRAGFERPILHGLCSYGFAGRALLHALCDSDPARFRSMRGRFRHPVYPGDILTTSIWIDAPTARYRVQNQQGHTIIDAGSATFV
jgi:acyl dehydratase